MFLIPVVPRPILHQPNALLPRPLLFPQPIFHEDNRPDENDRHPKTLLISWELPPPMCFKLNIDGCSKGNPGESGSGGILRDFAGRFVVGFNYRIGFERAIAAELWALYQGLMVSLSVMDSNATLLVETDSTEVWSVVHGNHGDEYKYADIVESCRDMMLSFRDVRIRHVYREANRAADFLANQSLGNEVGRLRVWEEPDWELHKLIYRDMIGVATPRVCKGVCKHKFYF